jgi:hypothetical protein
MSKCLAGLAFVLLAAVAGCGDNSRECGPGTLESGGACLPQATCGFGTHQQEGTYQCVPDETACSDGTVFDPLTGSCKIDPGACQDGTVLIGDHCVDPAGALVIDAEEGPEPNGLGILEGSLAPAGIVTLKGQGAEAFVLHGTIAPAAPDVPDVDTYLVTVAGPTFVHVTADGVGGTAAGFVAVAQVDDTDDPLADWRRAGLSLASDSAQRELLLPRAGTYRLAIADTRTLVEYLTTGTSTTAPGGPTSEYYVSLTEETTPTATELPVVGGVATASADLAPGALALYSVALGSGLNRVTLAMPSQLAGGAFVVLRGDMLAASATEGTVLVGDVQPGELVRIAIDEEYALSPTAAPFTLEATVSDAVALSTTGDTVMAPAGSVLAFDVASDDATLGMRLAWTPAIAGEIVDSNGMRAASFTPPTSGVTWSQYRGLVRLPAAGRYYFEIAAPGAVSVTSTITELTAAPITEGTPLTAPMNTFRAVPFTFDAGSQVWEQFDVTGVTTGGQTASWFDPLIAYGRLDNLATSAGTLTSEVPPIFTHAFSVAGGAFGRVLLSDGTPRYFVKVNATNPTGSPSVTLVFDPRADATNLGSLTSGSLTATGQTLSGATPRKYFVFRTVPGTTVTITVTRTSTVDTRFRRLNADESPLGAQINTSVTGPDIETFVQAGAGWTAFVVSAAGSLPGTRTFDVTVSVQ